MQAVTNSWNEALKEALKWLTTFEAERFKAIFTDEGSLLNCRLRKGIVLHGFKRSAYFVLLN